MHHQPPPPGFLYHVHPASLGWLHRDSRHKAGWSDAVELTFRLAPSQAELTKLQQNLLKRYVTNLEIYTDKESRVGLLRKLEEDGLLHKRVTPGDA